MSSVRVRTQNKVLEKIGAAKKSSNIQFDHAHGSFTKFEEKFGILENALNEFQESLKVHHEASNRLTTALSDLYDDSIGLTPKESTEFFKGYCDIVKQMDSIIPQKLFGAYQKTVHQSVYKIRQQCSGLENMMITFGENKAKFDHYTRKVATLREARDKRISSGKTEKPKDVEKLSRNTSKLDDASKAYTQISESTIHYLREFCDTRVDAMNPLLFQLIQLRINYALDTAQAIGQLNDLIKPSELKPTPLSPGATAEKTTKPIIRSSFQDFVTDKASEGVQSPVSDEESFANFSQEPESGAGQWTSDWGEFSASNEQATNPERNGSPATNTFDHQSDSNGRVPVGHSIGNPNSNASVALSGDACFTDFQQQGFQDSMANGNPEFSKVQASVANPNDLGFSCQGSQATNPMQDSRLSVGQTQNIPVPPSTQRYSQSHQFQQGTAPDMQFGQDPSNTFGIQNLAISSVAMQNPSMQPIQDPQVNTERGGIFTPTSATLAQTSAFMEKPPIDVADKFGQQIPQTLSQNPMNPSYQQCQAPINDAFAQNGLDAPANFSHQNYSMMMPGNHQNSLHMQQDLQQNGGFSSAPNAQSNLLQPQQQVIQSGVHQQQYTQSQPTLAHQPNHLTSLSQNMVPMQQTAALGVCQPQNHLSSFSNPTVNVRNSIGASEPSVSFTNVPNQLKPEANDLISSSFDFSAGISQDFGGQQYQQQPNCANAPLPDMTSPGRYSANMPVQQAPISNFPPSVQQGMPYQPYQQQNTTLSPTTHDVQPQQMSSFSQPTSGLMHQPYQSDSVGDNIDPFEAFGFQNAPPAPSHPSTPPAAPLKPHEANQFPQGY